MSFDINTNKLVVKKLLTAIECGEDFGPLLSDNATWWVPEACALSGTYSIVELMSAMAQLFAVYKSPPKFDLEYLTAEENRVAVFCSSTAELVDGSRILNRYHFLFIFENGLIKAVKEFMNTAIANQLAARIAELQTK